MTDILKKDVLKDLHTMQWYPAAEEEMYEALIESGESKEQARQCAKTMARMLREGRIQMTSYAMAQQVRKQGRLA